MDYTHSKGFCACENGYAVGTVGNEVAVISSAGAVTMGGVTVATSDRAPRTVKVALAAADTGGGVLAWANPESSSILIKRIILDVTTKSTGACTLDVGTTATNATTSSDTLLDGVDVGTAAGVFDNIENQGTNGTSTQKLAAGKWITASKASGAAAGLVGYAYIEYIVI